LDDVPGIRDVHSDGGDPWADPAECAIWINHRLLRGCMIDAAVLDGRVVGHAEWQVSHEPEPYGRHLYLSMLEIHPDFRGQGIGREMIEARVPTARESGCPVIRTIPDEDAKGFYAKLGFAVTGHIARVSAPARKADLPPGWKRCGPIPHSVVKRLPLRLGWYQACSEFMWEHYERPIRVAGDETVHLRARRIDGTAFIDVGYCGAGSSAGPVAWAAPEVEAAELAQVSFALASRLPAKEVSFAVDSQYLESIASCIAGQVTGMDDIVSRSVDI
jgi:GNAT superfamily N-acetyltransferase